MFLIFLVVVGSVILYLWWLAVRLAGKWASKAGASKKKIFLAKACAFLVFYIPLFGEDIPTIVGSFVLSVTHTGFKVHVTKEQWLKENPGQEADIAKEADWTEEGTRTDYVENGAEIRVTRLNKRFYSKTIKTQIWKLPLYKIDILVMDDKTNRVLAEYKGFRSGYEGNGFTSMNWRDFKGWLKSPCCSQNHVKLDQFEKQFYVQEGN